MKIKIKDELQDQLEDYKRGNQALLIEKELILWARILEERILEERNLV